MARGMTAAEAAMAVLRAHGVDRMCAWSMCPAS